MQLTSNFNFLIIIFEKKIYRNFCENINKEVKKRNTNFNSVTPKSSF